MRVKKEPTIFIGKSLKILIAVKGYRTGELADKLGMDAKRLSNLLCNNKSPSLEELLQIAKFFDVTTDFLLGLNGSVIFDMDCGKRQTHYLAPTVTLPEPIVKLR